MLLLPMVMLCKFFTVKNLATEKSGCLLTTIKIGTKDIEIKTDTIINNVAVSGSAIFKNNCPKALPAILTII